MVIITKPHELTDWFLKSLVNSPTKEIQTIEAVKKIHEYMEEGLISVQGDLYYDIRHKMWVVINNLKKQGVLKKREEGSCCYWSFV